jgi:hypothetical protein
MSLRFAVDRWAAWAPGLAAREDWLRWLERPAAISSEGMPALPEVAPMTRRRIDLLGRMALQTAYWNSIDTACCPVVFASRWGDSKRSLSLLTQLASGEALSPTAFSMSVHNAIGALFSIARQDPGNYTAIASGPETVEAAFCEATGMLADGAPAVMVVYYEEPLPVPFTQFEDPASFPHAWACRVVQAPCGGISLSAHSATDDANSDGASQVLNDDGLIGADLSALRFLTSDQPSYTHRVGMRRWQWSRHA